mmetsp:Transcript_20912/g.50515  ORF Transcript_20912/g.50515 Transcript_20912/m.50515 type:complete len:107 (+) Transcript_20912:2-322(+)
MGAQAVANILHAMATLDARGRMRVDDSLADALLARAIGMMPRRARMETGVVKVHGGGMLKGALRNLGIEPDPGLLEAIQAGRVKHYPTSRGTGYRGTNRRPPWTRK